MRSPGRVLAACAAIAAIGFDGEHGFAPAQVAKLLASDGAAGDEFGISISLWDDTALIGAWCDEDNGWLSGSAYIFQNIDGAWAQVAKLTASDGASGDTFGERVALWADTALIGAPYSGGGLGRGAAYVFERIDGVWTEVAEFVPDEGSYEWYGFWVALSGETGLVGAPYRSSYTGAAYVLERTDGVWTQVARLTASDGETHDDFGRSLAIWGDTALIGARGDDDHGGGSGSVYVFEKVGGVWAEVAKLTASDGAAGANFGHPVSMCGDTALIGAYYDDGAGWSAGAAYVFERIDGVWTEVAKLTASDAEANDNFGITVVVRDDTALVGAWRDDDHGTNSGSAYVFRKIGGAWEEAAKLSPADGAPEDEFGLGGALGADIALVGAHNDDDLGQDSGSVYVFARCAGDIDGDWDTDQSDLALLLADWGCTGGSCPGDLDGDGDTDHGDLGILLADWGCVP